MGWRILQARRPRSHQEVDADSGSSQQSAWNEALFGCFSFCGYVLMPNSRVDNEERVSSVVRLEGKGC